VSAFRLDGAARARVQVACDVVNKEITEQRRNIVIASIAIAIVAVPLIAAYPEFRRWISLVALLLVGAVVGQARREVATTYKGLVVRRIVKALGAGLSYSPTSSLTEKAFLAMELFADTPSSFRSEDEISGKKENVSYSIHEIHATRRQGKQTIVVFSGLMVRLDFNKNFQGHTTVVPNGEGRPAGSFLSDLLGGSHTPKAQVNLENPDFERIFDVYSTNDQEARYLLTPKLMELVLAANAVQAEGQIRLAFVQNSLYVAIPMRGNRLEAGLNQTVTPDTAVGELAEVVNFAERLVDTLELETRLWSRA
jgi:hypothetical protein